MSGVITSPGKICVKEILGYFLAKVFNSLIHWRRESVFSQKKSARRKSKYRRNLTSASKLVYVGPTKFGIVSIRLIDGGADAARRR